MLSDAEWASFDRLVDRIERAYIERCRQRAARLLDGVPADEAERFLAEFVESLRRGGAFRNDAWSMALAAEAVRPRYEARVIDLRDSLNHRLPLRS